MSADLLQRLMEAGTPMALIAEVADALAEARAAERILEKRRAADRERKEVQNPRIPRNSKEAVESAEFQDATPTPDKSPPDPQKLTPTPCVRESRARGYHRLPSGWQPSRPHPAPLQAKLDQWPPGAVADEIASFKRWAANAKDENGKGRKLDWDKALWNWLGRRHDEHYGRSRNGMGRHQPDDGLGPTARAAIEAFGSPAPFA